MAAPKWKENKLRPGVSGIPQELSAYEVKKHRIGNQTNVDDNNNKFFSIELWQCGSDWYVYTNYGRVSSDEYSGAVGLYGPGTESEATDFFDSKFKEKVRPSKGYNEITFVKAKVGSPKSRDVVHKVTEQEIPDEKKKILAEKTTTPVKPIQLHDTLKRLVNQWYNDNTHSITSNAAVTITSHGLETPLGVLTFGQINKGRTILSEIAEALKNKDDKEIRKLTGAFYSNIPNKMNRKISDSDLINSEDIIQAKADLLTQMEDALEIGCDALLAGVDKKYLDLGISANVIDKSDSEWKRIDHFIQSTIGYNHTHWANKISIKNVIKLSTIADSKRYDMCKIENEQELFHGSRNGNILGIIKKGLLIAPPEAPPTGYLFGKGIYAADKSSKSVQYSSARFGGPKNNSNNCFLFIIKMKLGKQLKMYSTGYDADKKCKTQGFDSTWGVEGHYLLHNEFITYTIEQTKITHIVELSL